MSCQLADTRGGRRWWAKQAIVKTIVKFYCKTAWHFAIQGYLFWSPPANAHTIFVIITSLKGTTLLRDTSPGSSRQTLIYSLSYELSPLLRGHFSWSRPAKCHINFVIITFINGTPLLRGHFSLSRPAKRSYNLCNYPLY